MLLPTVQSPSAGAAVALLAAYPLVVAVLAVVNILAPQRNGPLAISQVVAPHLLLGVIVMLPLLRVSGSRALRAGTLVALGLGAIRFGPGLLSIPSAQAETGGVVVVSWNLEAGDGSTDIVLDLLRSTDADIVALQELTPQDANAIELAADVTARFPHRAMAPEPGVAGLGLLSRHPVRSAEARLQPAAQVVVLEVDGVELAVVNAHPFPPRYQVATAVRLPLGYDATTRDEDLRTIHGLLPLGSGYAAALLVGDFNVTDREPGYEDLSHGLWDAHREVGQGPGSTWRPSRLEFLPLGILRIDYVFGSRWTRPLGISQDCAPRVSDHCVVRAVVSLD